MGIPTPSLPGSPGASLAGTEAVGGGGCRESVCASTAGLPGGDGRTGAVGGRAPGAAPVSGPEAARAGPRRGRCHVIVSGHATGAAPPPGGARAHLGLPRPSSALSVFPRSGLRPSRHCSGPSCGAQLFLSSLVPASGTSALSVHSRISPSPLGALRVSSVQSQHYSGISVNFRHSSATLGSFR